jgi:DNA mismatch repair protein MutL
MISHPGQALSDSSGFVVLINGRLVSDKIIVRAVREGYDSMLKEREFPIGYLLLDLPAEDVDVNVHPQKSEVRFRRPDQVFAVVRGAVLSAVRSIRRPMANPTYNVDRSSVLSGDLESGKPLVSFTEPSSASRVTSPEVLFGVVGSTANTSSQVRAPISPSVQPSFFSTAVAVENSSSRQLRFSELRYIGQLLECYLVCEFDQKLVVVDMHAAHERVNYNKIRRARADRNLTVQKLLIPEVVRLTSEQVTNLMEQQELLGQLAFEVQEVDHEQVAVHGVPSVVSHLDCAALLKDFAAEPLGAGWRERLEERIDHMVARLACHASVRSGDLLARHDAYALFKELDEAELAGACPHGRPVVAEFSREAVERWFGRDR